MDLEGIDLASFIYSHDLVEKFIYNIKNFCDEPIHSKNISDFKNLRLSLYVVSNAQDEGLVERYAFEAVQQSCIKIVSEICEIYTANVIDNYSNSTNTLKWMEEILQLCFTVTGSKIECLISSLLLSLLETLENFDPDDHSAEKQVLMFSIISCILQYSPAGALSNKFEIWEKLFSSSILSKTTINVLLATKILPILVKKVDCPSQIIILNSIWNYIRLKFLTKEEDIFNNGEHDIFVMLSVVIDISLNSTMELQQKYICEAVFWDMLFRGFVHPRTNVRKQVQYIFKRILNWAKNIHTCVKIPSYPYLYFVYDSTHSALEDLMSVWDDLLSLFEVLEQKQLHIVKPHLTKVLHLLSLCKHSGSHASEPIFNLSTSWIMTLFQRMWKHDAKYIRHWSAICILNQQDLLIFPDSNENLTCSFFEALFKVLNDPSIYARPEPSAAESLCINHVDIENFLLMYCNSFSANAGTGHFLQLVLHILGNSSYSTVPLLYIMKAISQMPHYEVWRRNDISNIHKVLKRVLQTQEIILQQSIASNLLKASVQLLDLKDLHYSDLCSFLNAFMDCKALIPNSALWTKTIKSLRKSFTSENSLLSISAVRELCYKDLAAIMNSLQKSHANCDLTGPELISQLPTSTQIKRIVRTWAVLIEANVFCCESCEMNNIHECLPFSAFISPFFKVIEATFCQRFSLCTATRNMLTIYFYLVQEIFEKNHWFFCEIAKWSELMGKIVLQVLDEIDVLHNLEDLEWIHFSVQIFDALLGKRTYTNENLTSGILKQYVTFFEKDFFQAINQVQCWCFIGRITLHVKMKSLVFEYIDIIMQKIMDNECLAIRFKKPGFIKYEASKKLWLDCVENALIGICHTLQFYIEANINHFSASNIFSIYQQVFELLKEENKTQMPLLLKSLGLILVKIENSKYISEALSTSWNCLKLWGFYRPAFKAFISMCFQTSLIKKFAHLLMQYVEKLKTLEDRPACLNILYTHICEVFEKDENRVSCFEYIQLLSHGLLFGPIKRKDQRVITEAIENIMGDEAADETSSLMYVKSDIHIRVELIHTVLTTIKAGHDETFISLLIEDLIQKQEEINQNKPSYFLNSYQHRVANRAWQSILLLNELVTTQLSKKFLLIKILKDSFTCNSQTSVKYFQDWIVLRIIHAHPGLLNEVFSATQVCFDHQPAYQVRLLSVFIHLTELGIISTNDSALQWMPLILKFCVAHNFEVRVYAILALQRLWKYCNQHTYSNVLEKFDFVQDSELSNPKTRNFPRIIDQLKQSYYFSSFHPVRSFNFQTIFVELLLHSNVTVQEWIQPLYFISKHKMSPFPQCFEIFSKEDTLEITPHNQLPGLPSQTNSSRNVFTNCNFQRKFVPSKFCDMHIARPHDCEDVLKYSSKHETQSKKDFDLIVVASLVEKLPNLGGLCRSCEALGVSEFVVKDLKSTENKIFQSLSVTAEKWITISEVKVHQLTKYLTRMKSEMYSIIGCEQTEKSQKLTEFKFPRKCLILLGHEKEGIPVGLLEYLDVSIEIPQNGIIRSLNVHVAGALLIYEFFRQHGKL